MATYENLYFETEVDALETWVLLGETGIKPLCVDLSPPNPKVSMAYKTVGIYDQSAPRVVVKGLPVPKRIASFEV